MKRDHNSVTQNQNANQKPGKTLTIFLLALFIYFPHVFVLPNPSLPDSTHEFFGIFSNTSENITINSHQSHISPGWNIFCKSKFSFCDHIFHFYVTNSKSNLDFINYSNAKPNELFYDRNRIFVNDSIFNLTHQQFISLLSTIYKLNFSPHTLHNNSNINQSNLSSTNNSANISFSNDSFHKNDSFCNNSNESSCSSLPNNINDNHSFSNSSLNISSDSCVGSYDNSCNDSSQNFSKDNNKNYLEGHDRTDMISFNVTLLPEFYYGEYIKYRINNFNCSSNFSRKIVGPLTREYSKVKVVNTKSFKARLPPGKYRLIVSCSNETIVRNFEVKYFRNKNYAENFLGSLYVSKEGSNEYLRSNFTYLYALPLQITMYYENLDENEDNTDLSRSQTMDIFDSNSDKIKLNNAAMILVSVNNASRCFILDKQRIDDLFKTNDGFVVENSSKQMRISFSKYRQIVLSSHILDLVIEPHRLIYLWKNSTCPVNLCFNLSFNGKLISSKCVKFRGSNESFSKETKSSCYNLKFATKTVTKTAVESLSDNASGRTTNRLPEREQNNRAGPYHNSSLYSSTSKNSFANLSDNAIVSLMKDLQRTRDRTRDRIRKRSNRLRDLTGDFVVNFSVKAEKNEISRRVVGKKQMPFPLSFTVVKYLYLFS